MLRVHVQQIISHIIIRLIAAITIVLLKKILFPLYVIVPVSKSSSIPMTALLRVTVQVNVSTELLRVTLQGTSVRVYNTVAGNCTSVRVCLYKK